MWKCKIIWLKSNKNTSIVKLNNSNLLFKSCIYKPKLLFIINKRYYSSKNNNNLESIITPVPILILKDLHDKNNIKSYRMILNRKGGIYSFFNTINGKQYIGSAKDFYIILCEHIDNRKSNVALQDAFNKYGLDKFNLYIYEYFTFESKVISSKALTDLETSYINRFNFANLYNFKFIVTSMLGYKHTKQARLKMIENLKNKKNHPMFGKSHTVEALALISKPGNLNPMFGKKHKEETKSKISKSMSKYPLGVGIYDLKDNLLFKFSNNTVLEKYLNIFKVTVAKYLNKSLIYKNIYRFKPIEG